MNRAPEIVGVLGADDMNPAKLASWLSKAKRIYAADSGADRCLAAGFRPDVLVGDLDSTSMAGREAAREVRYRPDQDHTDTQKLLHEVERDGFSEITLVGLEGDRPDHFLATLFAAAASPLAVSFGFRGGWGCIVKPERPMNAELAAKTLISLLPIGRASEAYLTGVVWPFEGEELRPAGAYSISNRAVGGPVNVRIESGAALLFVGISPSSGD